MGRERAGVLFGGSCCPPKVLIVSSVVGGIFAHQRSGPCKDKMALPETASNPLRATLDGVITYTSDRPPSGLLLAVSVLARWSGTRPSPSDSAGAGGSRAAG